MAVLDLLLPPKADASVDRQQTWKWGVFMSLGVIAFAVAMIYSLSFGTGPAHVIFDGFVTRAEAQGQQQLLTQQLAVLTKTQREASLRTIKQDLLSNISARCRAIKSHNEAMALTYTSIIGDLEDEYARLMHGQNGDSGYHEPSCDAV